MLVIKMEVENLVPPLKLCEFIPQGEFKKSTFAWCKMTAPVNKKAFVCYNVHMDKKSNMEWHINAPTTDEILVACKDIAGVLNPTIYYQNDIWIADCAVNRSGKLGEEFLEDDDFKNLDIVSGKSDCPVVAALKLWLKLKGIKYEE